MAYATIDDVAIILPDEEEIPSDAEDRVEVNLEEATDLVIGYLGKEFDVAPEDIPPAVTRVVARIALRAFLDDPWNPGAESEVNLMGPFSHTINWSKEVQARDLFLTDMEKLRLDRYKAGYSRGVVHLPMAGAGGSDWYAPTTY